MITDAFGNVFIVALVKGGAVQTQRAADAGYELLSINGVQISSHTLDEVFCFLGKEACHFWPMITRKSFHQIFISSQKSSRSKI